MRAAGSAQVCTTPCSFSEPKNRAQVCTTPQERAAAKRSVEDIVSSPAAARMFGKISLLALINPAITDGQIRVLALLAVPGLGTGRLVISAAELAVSLRWSLRKVKYCLSRLLKLGVLSVNRQAGRPNAYVIQSEVFRGIERGTRTQRIMTEKLDIAPCLKCQKRCRPDAAGWCRPCRRTVELQGQIRREVKAALALERVAS